MPFISMKFKPLYSNCEGGLGNGGLKSEESCSLLGGGWMAMRIGVKGSSRFNLMHVYSKENVNALHFD
jgi:hypothetical protein